MSSAIQRQYYRNGQLREEVPLRKGRRHGTVRTWHKNGVLASEEPYRAGLLHGVCRQWNESGKLLGKCRLVHGTGIQRAWHDNGQLQLEVSTVRGEFCGRNRIWLRDVLIEAIQTTNEIGNLCRQEGRFERVYVHRCGWQEPPPVVCCSADVVEIAFIDKSTALVRFSGAVARDENPANVPLKGQNSYLARSGLGNMAENARHFLKIGSGRGSAGCRKHLKGITGNCLPVFGCVAVDFIWSARQRGAWFCPVRHGTGAGCSRLSPGCHGTPAELDGPFPTTSPNGPWLPVERSAGRASSRRKLDETWAIILHVEATL